MKLFPFICLFVLISCQHKDQRKPIEASLISEKEALDFVRAYDSIWAKRDTNAMKETMHDNYIYFSSTGNLTNRSAIMKWFDPAGKYIVDTASRGEIQVTITGNTAIVNSRWIGNGMFGDERFDDDQRCGLVLQKLDGKIKLISEHCVQIVK